MLGLLKESMYTSRSILDHPPTFSLQSPPTFSLYSLQRVSLSLSSGTSIVSPTGVKLAVRSSLPWVWFVPSLSPVISLCVSLLSLSNSLSLSLPPLFEIWGFKFGIGGYGFAVVVAVCGGFGGCGVIAIEP